MKTRIIFILAFGLVMADPISKQIASADETHPSIKGGDSETKNEGEQKHNKDDTEQKNQVITHYPEPTVGDDVIDGQVEVFIEETVDLPLDLTPPIDDTILEGNEFYLVDDLYPNEVIEKEPGEIMDTAAGFVPIPIIRRRQKPRRRYATRRHFKRNPYRGVYYYYPYYNYYPYYQRSSLRYY